MNEVNKADLDRARTKALVDGLTGWVTKQLDVIKQQVKANQEAALRPSMIVENRPDLEPVAKAIRDIEQARSSEAVERSKDRAVLKELIEVATAMPVPMVQQPEQTINVSAPQVNVDLDQLASALESLSTMIALLSDSTESMLGLLSTIAQAVEAQTRATETLTKSVTSKRSSDVVLEFSEDGRQAIIKRQ